MHVPAALKIFPAMTFRPMSPALAQQIDNAYRALAAEALTGPTRSDAPAPGASAVPSTLDLRA